MKKTNTLKLSQWLVVIGLTVLVSLSQLTFAAKPAGPPPEVAVFTVTKQQVSQQQTLPGRVKPLRQAEVRPQVSGTIVKRLFTEGQQVEQGQQLYKIDSSRFKALLSAAQAKLASAQANVATVQARASRYAKLMKTNALTKQEYEDTQAELNQAKAAVAVAKADVELAEVDLEYTKVLAPISGQIGRSFLTEGTLVVANQAQQLARITQLDPVYVDLQLPQNQDIGLLAQLDAGNVLTVTLKLERNGKEIEYEPKGQVQFAEVLLDESTAATTLRASIPNPQKRLLPGQFVRAEVALGASAALQIPQRATTRTPDGQLQVMVVDSDDTVRAQTIETEAAGSGLYTVTKGLKDGERIIVLGYGKVKPEQTVSVVPWSD